MKKTIVLLLCLGSLAAGGCANRNEVSYEIPSNSSAGVHTNPGPQPNAPGTASMPTH